jgi:hypothetical protein
MTGVLHRICRGNQNTLFMLNTFFRLLENVEKYDRQTADKNIIRRMHLACWITQATDKHSEYVTLLFHGNIG